MANYVNLVDLWGTYGQRPTQVNAVYLVVTGLLRAARVLFVPNNALEIGVLASRVDPTV